MSVEYKACVASGWLVSDIEAYQMNLKTNFKYEDCFIPIDQYSEISHKVFGEVLLEVNAGELDTFTTADFLTSQDWIDEWNQKLIECGREDLAKKNRQKFLICQVV